MADKKSKPSTQGSSAENYEPATENAVKYHKKKAATRTALLVIALVLALSTVIASIYWQSEDETTDDDPLVQLEIDDLAIEEEAERLEEEDPNLAIEYYQSIIDDADLNEFELSNMYDRMARISRRNDQPQEALEFLKLANSTFSTAFLQTSIAITYYELGELGSALEYYELALQTRQSQEVRDETEEEFLKSMIEQVRDEVNN